MNYVTFSREIGGGGGGGNPDDGTVKAEIRTAEFVAAGQACKLYQKIKIK